MTTQQEQDINELARFIVEIEAFCAAPKVEERSTEDTKRLKLYAQGAAITIPKALYPGINQKHWQAHTDTENKLALGPLNLALRELKDRLTREAKERIAEIIKL